MAKASKLTFPLNDPSRDATLRDLGLVVGERAVVVNCSLTLPQLDQLYPDKIPQFLYDQAIGTAWYGIAPEEDGRHLVVVHVNGKIRDIARAEVWFPITNQRVGFGPNYKHPSLEQYQSLKGLDISSVTKSLGAHSAFYLN
jgi:hypothetical protein